MSLQSTCEKNKIMKIYLLFCILLCCTRKNKLPKKDVKIYKVFDYLQHQKFRLTNVLFSSFCFSHTQFLWVFFSWKKRLYRHSYIRSILKSVIAAYMNFFVNLERVTWTHIITAYSLVSNSPIWITLTKTWTNLSTLIIGGGERFFKNFNPSLTHLKIWKSVFDQMLVVFQRIDLQCTTCFEL